MTAASVVIDDLFVDVACSSHTDDLVSYIQSSTFSVEFTSYLDCELSRLCSFSTYFCVLRLQNGVVERDLGCCAVNILKLIFFTWWLRLHITFFNSFAA